MDEHTIKGFDPETPEKISLQIFKTDDAISIREGTYGNPQREIFVEYSNGTLCIRTYPLDSDTPVTVRLPETGGVEFDRDDYDKSIRGTE